MAYTICTTHFISMIKIYKDPSVIALETQINKMNHSINITINRTIWMNYNYSLFLHILLLAKIFFIYIQCT